MKSEHIPFLLGDCESILRAVQHHVSLVAGREVDVVGRRRGKVSWRDKLDPEERKARDKAACDRYRLKNYERRRQMQAKWIADNPDRIAASRRKTKMKSKRWLTVKAKSRNVFYRAVRSGRITRPDHCSRCGLVCKPDGHHPDYTKPLEVMWLCRICHIDVEGRTAPARQAGHSKGERE